MERQYKHGIRRVSLVFPSGYLNPGEEPLCAAQRELLEETGYTADGWHFLGSFAVDGNHGCGRAHLFVAYDAHQVTAPKPDEIEELEVYLMKPEDVRKAILQGDLVLLGSVAAFALATHPWFASNCGSIEPEEGSQ